MLAAELWSQLEPESRSLVVQSRSGKAASGRRGACLCRHPHTHQEERQEVMGLAPKAWREIKYQECAGQCSLSFPIQTGGRSEETGDLWG